MSGGLSPRESHIGQHGADLGDLPPAAAEGGPLNLIERGARTLACVCCAVMALLVMADIVLRPLRVEFFWAGEGSGILMAWTVFLALPAVTRTRSHISIDLFANHTGPRLKRLIGLFGHVLMMVYVALLIYFCARMAWNSHVLDLRSSSILRLPLVYAQGGVVVGLALLLLTECVMTCREVMGWSRAGGRPRDAADGG